MRIISAICFIALVFAGKSLFANEAQGLVGVYCSSEDLEAGFKDDAATYFCKQLGKRGQKKKSLSLIHDRDSAQALVNYLGTTKVSTPGEATYFVGGYAWRPDQLKTGARAIVTVGDFNKGFHGQGTNAEALVDCWNQVEEWIRENRATILEKAKKPEDK